MISLPKLMLVLSLMIFCDCANVLIVIPFLLKSHYLSLRPIGLELAKRDHNVTIITANKEEDPPRNYREIYIEASVVFSSMGAKRHNLSRFQQLSDIRQQDEYADLFIPVNEAILNSTAVQNFLKEDEHFDVVIAEQFYSEAFIMLVHRYNSCPLILMSSFGNCMKQNIIMGNPLQLHALYSEYISINDFTSVWSRMKNVFNTIREYYKWTTQYLIKQEEYAKKYLTIANEIIYSKDEKNPTKIAKEMPKLYDVQKSASLFLINRHFSFDPPAAYLPNIIEIGGLHLTEDRNILPADLQKIFNESTYGVIYVSFGSHAQVSDLSWKRINNLLELFRNLNQTVLWKCNVDITNLPANVVAKKWFPQNQILAHPNLKLFITHGGLISIQEAVFNGVPILGIPIYGDQTRNTLQAKLHGSGRTITFEDLDNVDILKQAVLEILNDDSIKKSAENLASKFKDRPRKALETAVLRIEKVIENKGFVDFGIPIKDISWLEYYFLDVFGVICLSVVIGIWIIIKINKFLVLSTIII